MLKLCVLLILSAMSATFTPQPPLEAAALRGPITQNQGKPGKDLKVKISVEKPVTVSGESLQLRVEIWNMGTQDVMVCKDFVSGPCDLRISFDPVAKVEHAISSGDCAPYISTAQPPLPAEEFAKALVEDWVSIAPKHFYGGTIELDPKVHPELGVAGRYRISGIFTSGGLLGQPCYYRLKAFGKEVVKLPAESWHGEVETNSVWIQVNGKKN